MTDAAQLLAEGRIEEALDEAKGQVRKAPGDPDLRGYLYQLFLLRGEWDRALNQLEVIGSLDPERAIELALTRTAIECERARHLVFGEGKPPFVHGPAQKWVSDLIHANILFAKGQYEEAAVQRNVAFEAAPHCTGSINGTAFQFLIDADDRLGPILECFIRSQYCWVPYNCIVSIAIEPPEFLQNVLWVRANVVLTDGDEVSILLRARYPGLPDGTIGPDGLHLLGRASSYETFGGDGGMTIGIGQKILASDVDDHPMLAIRTIEFDHDSSDEGQTEAGD